MVVLASYRVCTSRVHTFNERQPNMKILLKRKPGKEGGQSSFHKEKKMDLWASYLLLIFSVYRGTRWVEVLQESSRDQLSSGGKTAKVFQKKLSSGSWSERARNQTMKFDIHFIFGNISHSRRLNCSSGKPYVNFLIKWKSEEKLKY